MIVYTAPDWVEKMPSRPDDITISEFVLNPKYGRPIPEKSNDPYVCGITGKSYGVNQVVERVELAARALKKILNVDDINKGGSANGFSEWEKVVGVFSVNCVSIITRMPLILVEGSALEATF